MNAYVRKEIRLLWPSFLVALALALCVWLIPQDSQSHSGLRILLAALPIVFCPALVVMMTLDAFGREVSNHTLANLLAQPISRERIWWTKTGLLAGALLTVFSAWWICFILQHPLNIASTRKEIQDTFLVTGMILITAYAGGLWTVLLLRQVGAAFWITVLVPACLAMGVGSAAEKLTEGAHTEAWVVAALGGYSVAGFFWARHLFLRAQDVQWTGGEILLPDWFRIPRQRTGRTMKVGRHPGRALLGKEIQLHQSQFLIAGLLAGFHVLFRLIRYFTPNLKESWGWDFVSQQFWLLWFVMPLLVGCAAVAEERKLGTLEAQLGLPVRRRRQFLIKLGVALALGLAFGAVMPILLEGGRILPDLHNNLRELRNSSYAFPENRQIVELIIDGLSQLGPVLPTLPFVFMALSFVSLAFFASSLVRNTLQAIAPAIAMILLAWVFLIGGSSIEELTHFPLWRGWLIYLIGLPALTVTLVTLTYGNFKRVLVGWPVWRHNLIRLGVVLGLVTIATAAIYQRTWEWLMPLESTHGAARLKAADVVSMQDDGFGLALQFADGRSWSRRFYLAGGGIGTALWNNWQTKILPGAGFLEGSNWSSAAYCARDVLALSRDGSLWVSEKPTPALKVWRDQNVPTLEPDKLVRYGNDSDWKAIIGRWSTAYALKQDGTLWRIGTNHYNSKSNWPGLKAFDPVRLGNESDWAEISTLNERMALRKQDGRRYVFPAMTSSPTETLTLDSETILERTANLEQRRWRGVAWTSARHRGIFQVGLREDGTFCISGNYSTKNQKPQLEENNIPIGTATDWIAMAADFGPVVTLKRDGTLWVWDFPENVQQAPATAAARQLGSHSDWIGIKTVGGGLVSLAADGGLWLWRFPAIYPSGEFQPLLRPSRRPHLIGNVFVPETAKAK